MSEVKISFKNYKLLRDGELNLSNGSIFFAQGPNNVGKTSFLNLIQSIMEVRDETINPVTFGEKEGFSTGMIPGADGKMYQFRYDFNIDGKSKFQFIGPDNKVIKSVTDMRAIFNYTHFTMEEFFEWSRTVPGRKKQREIFMNLLSEKERKDILEIEEKINPTTGELVLSRRSLNTEIDFLKKKIDTSILKLDEQKLLSQKKTVNETYEELILSKNALEKVINGASGTTERIKSLKEQIEQLTNSNAEYMANSNTQTDEIDVEIEELLLKIETLKTKKKNLIEEKDKKAHEYTEKKVLLNEELEELNKSGGVSPEQLELKQEELTTINERIKKGSAIKDSILVIETKVKNLDYEKEQLKLKTEESEKYDTNIETLRKAKTDIIKNSENIPLGWSLGDDSITINNIPFTETDLSKSQATKAIAELMMRINKAPVMLMGDAEALGYDVLDSLLATAKEMGKVMIFAEHVRDADELQLVCYDEMDHVKKNDKKELF